MKIFKFEEALKVIGFNDIQRQEIVKKTNSGNVDLKYQVEKTCWDAFWQLYRDLVELRVKEMMDSVAKKEGKYTLDNTFMTKARQEAWRDMEGMLTGQIKEVSQIAEIRSKLKSLSKL